MKGDICLREYFSCGQWARDFPVSGDFASRIFSLPHASLFGVRRPERDLPVVRLINDIKEILDRLQESDSFVWSSGHGGVQGGLSGLGVRGIGEARVPGALVLVDEEYCRWGSHHLSMMLISPLKMGA